MKYKILFFTCLLFLSTFTDAQVIQKWKLSQLKSAMADAKHPTVFNFWATFCKPCIKEIPYFEQIVKKYKAQNVKLILVSLDLKEMYPKRIATFAKKRQFKSPIAFLDETNADLFCPAVDSSWSGAIPASLFLNNKTGYRNFFEDELSRVKFEHFIKEMVQQK